MTRVTQEASLRVGYRCQHSDGRAEKGTDTAEERPSVIGKKLFYESISLLLQCNPSERYWLGHSWEPLCLLRGPLGEICHHHGQRYALNQCVLELVFIGHDGWLYIFLPNSTCSDVTLKIWHRTNLQPPLISSPSPARCYASVSTQCSQLASTYPSCCANQYSSFPL